MIARLIAVWSNDDDKFQELADDYQVIDLDSFVERARIVAPEFFRTPVEEDVEGEIQDESDDYIITWEDGMNETVRIYEVMFRTDGEKATAVLNYLEEQDGRTILNILSPMLDDEALALVFDNLRKDGVF